MKKIPEEMKKAIEGDAFRFVEEKGHTDNTLVMNLNYLIYSEKNSNVKTIYKRKL